MQIDPRLRMPIWLQMAIQVLIVYSIITMCLETVPELERYRTFFFISETVVVILFTIEYLAFWILSDRPKTYPLQPMSIVDLLAILPYFLQVGFDLRGLRALRLMRVFRVLKLGRYSSALQTLGEAFKRSWPELSAVGFVAGIIVLISAMLLYYAEHGAQPEVYSSIPASMWWAIVTLTTVGYGDVYPITPIGKMVASFIMLLGIGFIAIPAGIVSSTLTEILTERERNRAEAQAKTPPAIHQEPK